MQLGVENVLALIDFQFGDRSTPGPFWHTARDDLAAVSADSLNSVGQLLVETYDWIERSHAGRAEPRSGHQSGAGHQ